MHDDAASSWRARYAHDNAKGANDKLAFKRSTLWCANSLLHVCDVSSLVIMGIKVIQWKRLPGGTCCGAVMAAKPVLKIFWNIDKAENAF